MSSKKSPNSFIFAAAMCLIFSLLLTAAAVGLKPYQEKNVLIDQQKNVLKALGFITEGQKISGTDVENQFKNSVTELKVSSSGMLVDKTQAGEPIYIVGSAEKVEKYAIPFSAYGLWSWVRGYIALSGDGHTVIGITVYSHGETPGLGGEVEKPWFQKQFVGKSITNNAGQFVSVGIIKGHVPEVVAPENQKNFVDGISGATLTSKGMDKYLKLVLEKYEPFSKRLREQG